MKANLILPESSKERENLAQKAALVHADAVLGCIKELNCSDAEKLELLDLMIRQLESS